MGNSKLQYVLITPAKNEEKYLSFTAESIFKQSVLPLRWIIVNDGSTDRTATIIEEYKKKFPFIELINKQPNINRSFASKALVFKEAYEKIQSLDFEFIGNLDADVTLPINYYETVLNRFISDPKLGMAGGVIVENINNKTTESTSGANHVAGAFQLFRRSCFEQIGGYKPVRTGGIDSIALISARMNGWKTQMLRELKVLHHRPAARNVKTALRIAYLQGKTDYNIGLPLVFALVKFIKRIFEYPYIIASIYRITGYITYSFRCKERDVGKEFVKYYRKEMLTRVIKIKKKSV